MYRSPPNYMDGVPVKISEKYKPPPKISLPQSIVQRLVSSDDVGEQTTYDFTLEQNILLKIAEWKNVQNREQTERRERIRQRQIERQQIVDEHQKQLLTAVSYPEDLSDDEAEHLHEPEVKREIRFNSSNFDTILMPTVMPGHETRTYCEQLSTLSHKNNSYRTVNPSKINYSDFENDTSSPFDNIELKTINDLDILAQVLNTLQSNDTSTPETSTESTASGDNTPIQHTILPNDNTQDSNGVIYQPQSNQSTNYIGYGSVNSNQSDRLTEFPRYATSFQSNENYINLNSHLKQNQQFMNVTDVQPTVIPNSEYYYNSTLGTNCDPLTNGL